MKSFERQPSPLAGPAPRGQVDRGHAAAAQPLVQQKRSEAFFGRGHPVARLADLGPKLTLWITFCVFGPACGGSIALLPPELAGRAGPLPIDHPFLGVQGVRLGQLQLRELQYDGTPPSYDFRISATLFVAEQEGWRVRCRLNVDPAVSPPVAVACLYLPQKPDLRPQMLLLWANAKEALSGWFLTEDELWRVVGSNQGRYGQVSWTMGWALRREARGVPDAYAGLETAQLSAWASLAETDVLTDALGPFFLVAAVVRDPREQAAQTGEFLVAKETPTLRPEPTTLDATWLPFFRRLATRAERDAIRVLGTLANDGQALVR